MLFISVYSKTLLTLEFVLDLMIVRRDIASAAIHIADICQCLVGKGLMFKLYKELLYQATL